MRYPLFFIGWLTLMSQGWAQTGPPGSYLGQMPPGKVPQIFAPGFISTEAFEFAGSFSPDGRIYVFTRRPDAAGAANRLYITVMGEDGTWTPPSLAPFGRDVMEIEPHIAPSGDCLFFGSDRSKPAEAAGRGEIWFVERNSQGWGEAKYLKGPVNRGMAMYVTATRRGDLYYTGYDQGQYGIFRIVRADTGYGEPEYLGPVPGVPA